MSSYEELQKKLDASIRKDEARQKAIRAKREEKQAIKKAGGGHALARAMMSPDTDFNYGSNEGGAEIDRRIEQEAAGRCMGRVVCQVCKTFHGYCVEVAEEKEKQKMLPTGDEGTGTRSKRAGGMDWLKNEDLSKTGKEAKILGVRADTENRFGPRVTIKLAIEGKIKFWGIPTTKGKSPNYRLLIDKFGNDENDWLDKRILILLEQDEFSGQYFARVDFPQEEKPRKPRT